MVCCDVGDVGDVGDAGVCGIALIEFDGAGLYCVVAWVVIVGVDGAVIDGAVVDGADRFTTPFIVMLLCPSAGLLRLPELLFFLLQPIFVDTSFILLLLVCGCLYGYLVVRIAQLFQEVRAVCLD